MFDDATELDVADQAAYLKVLNRRSVRALTHSGRGGSGVNRTGPALMTGAAVTFGVVVVVFFVVLLHAAHHKARNGSLRQPSTRVPSSTVQHAAALTHESVEGTRLWT